MLNDARHAIRILRRRRGVTLTAIITLAVGIGATTGVFSIYDAVLLKPLPFDHPERTVAVRVRQSTGGDYGVSGGILSAVRSLPAVERAAVTIGTEQTLLAGGDPELVRGALVTDEFFAVFGVSAAVGRALGGGEDARDSPLVLSYRMWQRRFGGDTGVVGRALRLGNAVHTVVGVMPEAFRYPDDVDYWAPYVLKAGDLADIGAGPFAGVARLRNSERLAAAGQASVLNGLPADREGGSRVVLEPLIESMVGLYRSNLALLLGAVTLVLLISCLNAANLLLAQATDRQRELAIRAAIGATRWRLLRQLVVESVMLASAGAVAGLALAQLIVLSLPSLGTLDVARLDEATLDWRVLAFAVAAAAGSVCIFGIVPPWLAIRHSAPAPGPGRAVAGSGRRRAFHALIALQIAATLALLVGSALTLASLYRQHHVDFGFETTHLSVTTIRPSSTTLKRIGGIVFYERVLDALRGDPELESVAAMSHVPLEPRLAAAASVTTDEGLVVTEGSGGPRLRVLSPGALRTLGVPIVRGRDFSRTDREGAPLVTIVNETLAHKLWDNRDPLGESILVESRGAKHTYFVVGIARDFRPSIRRAPQPELYLSSTQERAGLKIVVRSRARADAVAGRIQRVIHAEDPEAPIGSISTVGGLIWDATAYTRFHAVLVTIFGAFAALLATSGILAVVMYTVARRTHEIGIRIAIGATPHEVVTLFVREMMLPLVVGLAAGLLAIYSLASLLQRRGLLFDVGRFHAGLYAAVTAGVAVVALLAAWLPARRAGRVEPVVALRSE